MSFPDAFCWSIVRLTCLFAWFPADDDMFVSEGDESELQTVEDWVEMMAYFDEIETECDEATMDFKALERSLPDEASLMS